MPVLRSWLVLVLCIGVAAAADLRVLNEAKPLKGDLVSIDAKTLTLKDGDKTVRKPLAEVLGIDLQTPPTQLAGNYMQVELIDGSLLNCKPDSFTFDGKQVELIMLPDTKIKLPLTALSYILKGAQDAKVREHADWKAILKSRRTHDCVVNSRMDYVEGTAETGKGTELNFTLKTGGRTVGIDLTKPAVQGCIFVNKHETELAPTVKLVDMQHNALMVNKLEVKEGGDFHITTATGTTLVYKRNQVARLDYSWLKQVYLSDLEPTVQDKPMEDVFDRDYRRDKNSDGNQLQLGGQRYPKGLFIPAPTKLLYKLGGEYNHFVAQVGVDETVRGRSHVRLIIEGDGKELFSAEISRADKRREVKVSVKDVQELRITVEPVEPLNLSGHHLDLADAKVTK